VTKVYKKGKVGPTKKNLPLGLALQKKKVYSMGDVVVESLNVFTAPKQDKGKTRDEQCTKDKERDCQQRLAKNGKKG